MIHLQLTVTYGRATLLSRALYSYLQQDYEGRSIMLIFNTGRPYELGNFEIPNNKQVIIVNSKQDYNSVGEKYLESLNHFPSGISTISIKDDDDIETSDGMRLALEGLEQSNKTAYKSAKSYFHYGGKITEESNNLEGSIYMDVNHIKKNKFGGEFSVKYHDNWLLPLLENQDIKIDEDCKPYFIYDWHNPLPTFKMSGAGESINNFNNSQLLSNDWGNGILLPSPLNYHKILEDVNTRIC